MKVLRKPKEERNWSRKVFCTGMGSDEAGCGAKLKVYREDLIYKDRIVKYKCVCCNVESRLGFDWWPQGYRELPEDYPS